MKRMLGIEIKSTPLAENIKTMNFDEIASPFSIFGTSTAFRASDESKKTKEPLRFESPFESQKELSDDEPDFISSSPIKR